MHTIDLGGEWTVSRVGHELTVPARVPGQVQMDLLRAGAIEDPYYRDRESEYRWIGQSAWEYRREFAIDAAALGRRAVRLVCEGIDTVAAVTVNGTELGRTDNMFRRYVFDLKGVLRAGANSIAVRIDPPMEYASGKAAAHPYRVPYAVQGKPDNHNFVRKSGTHFGWDWGPYLYATGIWRAIRVEAYDEAVLAGATVEQDHATPGRVRLAVRAFVESAGAAAGTVTVSVDGRSASREATLAPGENRLDLSIEVERPELWWPHGYGAQRLYDVDVSFAGARGERTTLRRRVGLRTLELVREPDSVGETFYLRVNGVPVFAKGANWIPADSFDVRVTRESLSGLLASARDANMNVIRVWGGGIYEQDAFYDLCDELGLMVWQDFMFACALYPADEEFLANVEAEARHQVRRLMSHPCIALWCGNNENEQAFGWFDEARANRDRYIVDYNRLYVDTLGRVAREEDPRRAYWPSSPSNGIQAWGEPNDSTRGDVHYWSVWHGGKPFSDYLTVRPRFCSEFGFQSFPSVDSLAGVLGPSDWNVTSPMMEYRQRSGIGNLSIVQHISRWFRMPTSFDGFVYVSQVLQALSLKTGIEHWRRLKPLCMGTIYWQINDIWQGPSWSSIEYDGRWKMLQYYARHFFAPVLVSAYEDGGALQVWVTSDERSAVTGELTIELWTWAGERVARWAAAFAVEALGSASVWSKGVDDLLGTGRTRDDCFVTICAAYGTKRVSNVHFLAPLKRAELAKPAIDVAVRPRGAREIALTVTSDAVAPFVFLSTPAPGRFSDNGMMLMPGVPVELAFHARGDVEDIEDFRRGLKVTSLRDGYA